MSDELTVIDKSHGHFNLLLLPFLILSLGNFKNRIFYMLVHNLAVLCTRIVKAVETVDVNMLQRVWKEMKYRLHSEMQCKATRNAHVEYILQSAMNVK